MSEEYDIYTGNLTYKEISFIFVFDKTELRLIPPEDKKHLIEWDWKMKKIRPGVSTFADPISVQESFLIGDCNETKHRIIFFPKRGSTLELFNPIVIIPLEAYIICELDIESIDRISISCPEINYIHPVNQAVSLTLAANEFEKNGIVTLSTQDFDVTTTEKQLFFIDGREVTVYFGISRSVSLSIDRPPLLLESSMMFEFAALSDYDFIRKLWWIAREFLRFLCYRKNVYIPQIKLSAPYENGKHLSFASMYFMGQNGETEKDVLNKRQFIKQVYISGHEGKILSDIAQGNLYLRHIPETYRSGRHINAARFVMITAAFEWEFHRKYPCGVEKSEESRQAEVAVSTRIQKSIDESSGKQKKIYKFLKKLVKSDSLQAEIIQMGKDFSDIIGVFGNRLYKLNGQELNYAEMGERLADQRNHFAHGDLDKDFIGLSLLDLMYLEYVVYALQLKHYGLEKEQIQKAINDLFHLGFAI